MTELGIIAMAVLFAGLVYWKTRPQAKAAPAAILDVLGREVIEVEVERVEDSSSGLIFGIGAKKMVEELEEAARLDDEALAEECGPYEADGEIIIPLGAFGSAPFVLSDLIVDDIVMDREPPERIRSHMEKAREAVRRRLEEKYLLGGDE